MKAIIEVARRDSIFDAALTDVKAGGNPDYVLAFESARALFAEITPARLDLLDALRRAGACSVYALAKTVGRTPPAERAERAERSAPAEKPAVDRTPAPASAHED